MHLQLWLMRLIDKGIFMSEQYSIQSTSEEKLVANSPENKIAYHFSKIMEALGLDLSDPSLKKTPQRVAKMYVKEVFSGLKQENFPSISTFPNKATPEDTQIVLVKDITIHSFCEHHFVPMHGHAHIAYIPKDKLIGLSKLNRIAQFYSKRPQLQERLTKQIADSLSEIMETEDVAVYIEAKHFCVCARGSQDQNSKTVTHSLQGSFKKDTLRRQEFFQMIS